METNALGARVLAMYESGSASRAHLDAAHSRGWISDADYEQAINPDPEEEPAP